MYLFRDFMARETGMEMLVHTNPEAIEKNINPFDHGSALHTDVWKTEGLKQALDHYKFDVVFGGLRSARPVAPGKRASDHGCRRAGCGVNRGQKRGE